MERFCSVIQALNLFFYKTYNRDVTVFLNNLIPKIIAVANFLLSI